VRELMLGSREEHEVPGNILSYWEDVRFTAGILLKGYSQATVIDALIGERNLSYNAAYRLIKDTEELYGAQAEVDKRMKRMIASEMAQRAYELAEEKGKPRDMVSATNAFTRAWGLDRDDPDLPDFGKLDTPANILVLDTAVAERLKALPAGGSVDLNNLLDEIVEDVEYEEPESGAESGD